MRTPKLDSQINAREKRKGPTELPKNRKKKMNFTFFHSGNRNKNLTMGQSSLDVLFHKERTVGRRFTKQAKKNSQKYESRPRTQLKSNRGKYSSLKGRNDDSRG